MWRLCKQYHFTSCLFQGPIRSTLHARLPVLAAQTRCAFPFHRPRLPSDRVGAAPHNINLDLATPWPSTSTVLGFSTIIESSSSPLFTSHQWLTYSRLTPPHQARDTPPVMAAFIPPAIDFLFDLPEELLALVVEFAVDRFHSRDTPRIAHEPNRSLFDTKTIQALCLTCRTLRRLAQPWLYHNLDFGVHSYKSVRAYKPTIRLHRTLEQNPHFRKHCRYDIGLKPFNIFTYKLTRTGIRALDIDVADEFSRISRDFQVAKDIAAWSTTARKLKLRVGYLSTSPTNQDCESTWDLVYHVASCCKAIEYLHLRGDRHRLRLDHIFNFTGFPKLKGLHLEGLGPSGDINVELQREVSSHLEKRTNPSRNYNSTNTVHSNAVPLLLPISPSPNFNTTQMPCIIYFYGPQRSLLSISLAVTTIDTISIFQCFNPGF